MDALNYPVALEAVLSSIRLARKAVLFDLSGVTTFGDFGYTTSESSREIRGGGVPWVDAMVREPADGRWFAFCAMNPKVRTVWNMLGIAQACPTFDSVEAAEEAWRNLNVGNGQEKPQPLIPRFLTERSHEPLLPYSKRIQLYSE